MIRYTVVSGCRSLSLISRAESALGAARNSWSERSLGTFPGIRGARRASSAAEPVGQRKTAIGNIPLQRQP